MTSYDQSLAFVIDKSVETSLVTGLTYRIKLRAVNVIGTGDFSDVVEIALVNPPAKPNSPLKIDALSTDSKMTVRWDPIVVPAEELPSGEITYYKLYMDDGQYGDYELISHAASSLTQMTVNNLTVGRAYRFKVLAGNFNQEGLESDSSLHYACQPPSGLQPPILTQTTSSSMLLEWSEPASNGGCPLLGYYLFRDDGVTGDPTIEINTDNDPSVRNIPTLRSLLV